MGGPGRGPMGGGMVGQKAMDFGPSAKRLADRMRPDRLAVTVVVLLTVASVALMSVGPRVLGHATDLVFSGFVGRQVPAGSPDSALPDAVQGQDVVPGPGRRLRRRGGARSSRSLAIYVVASLLGWLAGYVLNGVVQRTVRPDARGRRGQDQPAAARLLRPLRARRAAQPGHQRHRQRQHHRCSRR